MAEQPWNRALVTGASAGLGREFAEQLAARGTHLILVARDTGRMEEHALSLTAQYGVEVEVLGADLTVTGQTTKVAKRIQRATSPVDLVINNAGFGGVGAFADQSEDSQVGMVDLNIRALVRLTHVAVTSFADRGGRGGIINVASLGAFQPVPFMATYTATKAFVKSFSEGIYEELRGTDITVSTLCPGLTRTEFAERADASEDSVPDWMWMEAGPVVKAGLAGVAAGRAVVLPGLGNKVIGNLADQTPSWLSRQVSSLLGKGL